MGRPKSYDRHDLVERAMNLFRDHGYARTTTQMLVEEFDVNRNSMYLEFGSKRALFEASLRRYEDEVIEPRFGRLEKSDAGLQEIEELFQFYGSAGSGPGYGRGCLLCNSAVEFGPQATGHHNFAERYFDRIATALENALSNAKELGEIRQSTEITQVAHFLTATLLGMFVLLRAKAPDVYLDNASSGAIDHLEKLRLEVYSTE